MPLPNAGDDLANRRPVWLALSDLFLDTDVTSLYDATARVLSASPYSLEQLESILFDEVYPVCCPNLLSVAGVWTGFDAEWLEHRILALNAFKRVGARLIVRRLVPLAEDWLAVSERVSTLRASEVESS